MFFFFLVVAQFYKLVILFFVCFFCNLSFTSGFPTLWRTSWDKKKKKKSKRHQTSCTKRGDFKFRLSKPSTSSFQPQRHNQGRDSDLWHFFKLALKTFFPAEVQDYKHSGLNVISWTWEKIQLTVFPTTCSVKSSVRNLGFPVPPVKHSVRSH